MKKIVPFNNVLSFKTKVSEITSISLEHEIQKSDDAISGKFIIEGDYKNLIGDIETEKFSFELPFDIALGVRYERDNMVVDIDDFRYELIDSNRLKVNIDLYIDGDIIPDKEEEVIEEEEVIDEKRGILKEMDEIEGDSRIDMDNDFLEDTIDFSKNIIEEVNKEPMETEASTIVNENNNINIFGNISDNETYATYKVYTVMDTDTIDGIISKYNISKELLGEYNNIEDIKSGDKLIIPSDEK
ncbi:putative uncharacterized protein [Clostridium sp. CAG:914]|nr:putative uncharacterized protein [Clostridium sp. CAG:914]